MQHECWTSYQQSISEACAAGGNKWRQEYSTVLKQLLYGIGWVDNASKVKLFDDNRYDVDKLNLSRWGVDYHKYVSGSEHIPNCGPFVMVASEYEYKGNSDWTNSFQISKLLLIGIKYLTVSKKI